MRAKVTVCGLMRPRFLYLTCLKRKNRTRGTIASNRLQDPTFREFKKTE